VKTWWYILQLLRATGSLFVAATLCGVAYFGLPLVLGLATQAFFDTVSGHAPLGLNLWTALALLLCLNLLRSGMEAGFQVTFINLRYAGSGLLRANLLRQLLVRPSGLPLPDSSGEAISRFRDDAESIMYDHIDASVDLIGRSIFAILAFAIMLRIDLILGLAVAGMLALSVPIIALAGDRIATYARLNHEAIGRVTGFLAEMFAAVLAIKAAGATDAVVAHFERLGERRRQAAVRDQLWQAVVNAVDANVVTLGIGLVLLFAGQALRAGAFSVGDFSLFVIYLTELMWFPDEIARWITSYRQAGVSLGRMAHLLGDADPRGLVASPSPSRGHSSRTAWPLDRPSAGQVLPIDRLARGAGDVAIADAVPPAVATPAHVQWIAIRPPILETRGLAYRYPSSGRGIQDVSLAIDPGSFVVLTGAVAAGKTTLLQVLLGILPRDAGEIVWEGSSVADPTAFFGPPRTSYVPQTPRLFSDSFRANLLEGMTADDARLRRAIQRAGLDPDVVAFPEGWETRIGPRGARLSGGQIQRTAAARAFLREPRLLVLDDLSSALDLPTEELLWERLAQWRREAPGLTILAVSHRPAALSRADRVFAVVEGRLVSE
jgi:ATP-binding cassette subfamily B protein